MNSNQRKLVEAFKTFIDKTVYPSVSNNESVMKEWKYFSNLISSDPIDYSKIDFYLMMANKNNNNYGGQSPVAFKSNQYSRYKPELGNAMSNKVGGLENSNTSNSSGNRKNSINSNSKKMLLASIQQFQGMLARNQDRLENFNRKEHSDTLGISTGNRRYY